MLDWSPRVVLALVEDLIHAPNSAFAASIQGGPEYRGWGKDRHMVADIWDATVAGIYVSASSKKKSPTYPRPAEKKQSGGRPITELFPSRGKSQGVFGG